MEQGFDSEPIDRSKILNIKPLRSLAPVFPSPPGMSLASNPQASFPFVCVPPTGPFPPGLAPIYPFLVSTDSKSAAQQSSDFGNAIPSPAPLNAFRTPDTANGSTVRAMRGGRSQAEDGFSDDDYSDSMDQSGQFVTGRFKMHTTYTDNATNSGRQKGKTKRQRRNERAESSDFDEEGLVNSFLISFNLLQLDTFKKDTGDKDLVDRILLVYSLLRRRLSQYEDISGSSKRPDLKAGNLLMSKDIRTNKSKKIGHVPGVEVGDIFLFRMELCLVGLHAQSMGGIDYMTVKLSSDNDPVAVSIVSAGGYDDDGNDGDVLIYTGQGGVQRQDGLMFDQKLERGNLALEKSRHRGNEVRVIRGLKDVQGSKGKIYIYDGLYKIEDTWAEKNKSGCNIFKYKLLRLPGQPEAFTLWKSIQQWKDGVTSRVGVILPDLTSGSERLPVSLVNDIDDVKGPDYFTYITTPKYIRAYLLSTPSLSCICRGGCQPGDVSCPCIEKNDGYLPYSSLGVLLSYPALVHECGKTCACPSNCRNRMTQAGLKVRLEVFKTTNRGWGLRSWDPIRSGGFICEYAGEVMDASKVDKFASEFEDDYIFDATRIYQPLEGPQGNRSQSPKVPYPLMIDARREGNVARFMNHSCSPNVYWQPVLRESDNEAYLHIAFFAIKHIPPMQELTFDYGIIPPEKADRRRKQCMCGSSRCRGFFY
ncbi:histone modifying enzyme [Lithospermum erythrorhizon]|uniref:Histone modifying enzyme n=1 Tax=Lithospermum erythrorhizon TaxID=34254 RepID=A0AAV3RXG4_LITER